MDSQTIRSRNFVLLVDQCIGNKQTKKGLALALEVTPSFISQLYAGKAISDAFARRVESVHGLPHGWMDAYQRKSKTGVVPKVMRSIDCKEFMAASMSKAIARMNLWLTKQSSELTVISVETVHMDPQAQAIRLWFSRL